MDTQEVRGPAGPTERRRGKAPHRGARPWAAAMAAGARAPLPRAVPNSATVSASAMDPNPANNQATVSVTVN